jgi:hypothetical protein
MRAYDVFWELNNEIFEKNKSGNIPWLLLEREYDIPPILPTINRDSLDMGFNIKLNAEPQLLEKITKFLHSLPFKKINYNVFKKLFFKKFLLKNWKNDVDDVLYFLEKIRCVKLSLKNGDIVFIQLVVENINNINNTNSNILKYWTSLADTSYKMDSISNKSIILTKLLENS